MNEYLEKEKYWTDYILKGGEIDKVPEEVLTDKLVEIYIKLGGRNIYFLPKEYLKEQTCLMFLKNGGDISAIPETLITQKIYDYDKELKNNIKTK